MPAWASHPPLEDFFLITSGAIFQGDSRKPSFFSPQAPVLARDGGRLKGRSIFFLQDPKGKTLSADRAGQKFEKPSFQELPPSAFRDLTALPIL
jgi:hypothetical protein